MSKRLRTRSLLRKFRPSRRRAIGPLTLHHRRLQSEPLEDRRLLSITVNTLLDDSSIYTTSLRDAITAATPGETIDFDPALFSGGPATLQLTTFGELFLNKSVTINGPGAGLLTIRAHDPTPAMANGDGDRVFHLDNGDGGTQIDVEINGMTITGGDVNAPGGAIFSLENLTIANSVITGNSTSDVNGNSGGAIYQSGGALTVSRTTLSNNHSGDGGGAILQHNGQATITDSLFWNNSARFSGGGIFNDAGSLTVRSSTISSNSVGYTGGGFFNRYGTASLTHLTITANTAPPATGSGISSLGDATTHTNVGSSIVSANANNDDVTFVLGGTNPFTSLGYNLIGLGNGSSVFTETGDQLGVTAPQLGLLTDNGGPTLTYATSFGSPAIDAGDPAEVAGVGSTPLYDQRGLLYTRVFNGRVDIGAFEQQDRVPQNFVVDTLADEIDGDYSAGNLSLREAVELANENVGQTDVISFSPLLNNGTIELALGEILISDAVSISGPGASVLTVRAYDPTPTMQNGDGHRILTVNDGTLFQQPVTISGLTLSGGDLSGIGGAIFSFENLVLFDSVITGNATNGGSGGAIYNDGGSLSADRTTFSYNHAGNGGGAVFNHAGAISINDSLFWNNSALFSGGGIFNDSGSLLLSNDTFYSNTAGYAGGGLFNGFGTASLQYVTITGNSAPSAMGAGISSLGDATTHTYVGSSIVSDNAGDDDVVYILGGTNPFASEGYNLIGLGNGSSVFTEPGDQVGVTNPLLAELASYGGPTMSCALMAGSPAIDAGDPAVVAPPSYDQRGAPFDRIADGNGDSVARIDIGAFERQTLPNLNLVVDTLEDEDDGDFSAGHLSLREAIGLANGSVGDDVITFDPGLSGGTISLYRGDLKIAESLSIDATNLSSNLVIDTHQTSRIFDIQHPAQDVALAGLTLTGGQTNDDNEVGGAIRARSSNLTISKSTITGNTTLGNQGFGAAIFAENLTLTQSTVSNNNGIFDIYAANVTLSQSTISGGSVYSLGGMTIVESTISGADINALNSVTITQSTITSSLIYQHYSMLIGAYSFNISGSIVSGDSHVVPAPPFDTLTVNYSVIGTNVIPTAGGNNIVTNDPVVGPLADNGGPTQTCALLPGSPALNAGDPSAMAGVGGVPLYDQRGSGFDRVAGGRIDIGAFEVQSVPLTADGNGDGWVDGLDYLIWASSYGTHPGPDGDISDGDYNDDGWVDGLDYLLWASNYGNHAAVAASQTASTQEQLAAVDATHESAYSGGATVQDWQVSQAFDAVLNNTVLKHKDKKDK